VSESDLKALFVVRAHLPDAFLIHIGLLLISEVAKEVLKGLSDPADDLYSLQPL
jgi:hypothetical protein